MDSNIDGEQQQPLSHVINPRNITKDEFDILMAKLRTLNVRWLEGGAVILGNADRFKKLVQFANEFQEDEHPIFELDDQYDRANAARHILDEFEHFDNEIKFVEESEQLQELSIHTYSMLIENKGCIARMSLLVYEDYLRKVNDIMAEFGKQENVFLNTQDWNDIKSQLMSIANLNNNGQ